MKELSFAADGNVQLLGTKLIHDYHDCCIAEHCDVPHLYLLEKQKEKEAKREERGMYLQQSCNQFPPKSRLGAYRCSSMVAQEGSKGTRVVTIQREESVTRHRVTRQ